MKKYVYFNEDGQKITFIGKKPVEAKSFIFNKKEYYLLKVVIEDV